MLLEPFFASIEALPAAVAIAESDWIFPTLETVHVLAIALVFGSIALLDLRLLGVASRNHGVLHIAREMLPWTWGAFSLAIITGGLMFISNAVMYYNNWPFLVKMVLLLLAGANMAVFHLTEFRSVKLWNLQLPPPIGARLAAMLSLTFWVLIVACGRWIGFVQS